MFGQGLELLSESRKVGVIIWSHGIIPHGIHGVARHDLQHDLFIVACYMRETIFTESLKDNEHALFPSLGRRSGSQRAHVVLLNVRPCPRAFEFLLESTSRYMASPPRATPRDRYRIATPSSWRHGRTNPRIFVATRLRTT